VPLLFVFHIVSIAQAKQWREVSSRNVGQRLSAGIA
jgi:hypothetical protein